MRSKPWSPSWRRGPTFRAPCERSPVAPRHDSRRQRLRLGQALRLGSPPGTALGLSPGTCAGVRAWPRPGLACARAWRLAPGPAMTSVPSAAGAAIAPAPSALPATPRPIVQASAPERYRVQFTIGQETHEKLRRLQALLRREIPDGDPGAIFDRALTVLLEKVEKTKLAVAAKPRPSRPIRPAADPRTPPIRPAADPQPPIRPAADTEVSQARRRARSRHCAARPALPHCAAGGQARGLAARRWPVRLRVLHRKEMHGEHVPGVPPHPALCEAGAGHRRQHLPSLLAPQPVRGRADLRPAWPVDRP